MSRAPEPRAGAPVVVSGSGVVSPTGVGLAAFEEALFAGRSAVRAHAVDLPGLEVPIVPIAAVAGAAFDAASVGAPSRLPLDRATAMALAAAEEAARQAALAIDDVDGERLGIFWGSGMAGATTFEQTCRTVYADQRRMRPTSVITTMPNAPTAELALRLRARGVPVTSTKAIHGHLLGAGGAVELLASACALVAQRLPPTANTGAVDPSFAIDVVTGAARPAHTLRHAMSSSFAFGGTNAVLITSRVG
jgi:3-oxoacyl-[acyl-carrier-protein] synthase II